MNRRLSAWWLAVVPATLLGHMLSYALSGRTQADAHHAYAIPTLEFSLAVVALCCFGLLVRAFSGRLAGAIEPSSLLGIWAKLAIGQSALFALLERVEGYPVAPAGFAVQLFVAFLAALAIVRFTQLVRRCERAGVRALSYVRRLLTAIRDSYHCRKPYSPAYALAVTAGTARFQRPPPL